MSKSISVTVTVTCSAEVPASWDEEELQDKLSDVLVISVESNSKKVELSEADIDIVAEEE